jgi:hypothetical protein
LRETSTALVVVCSVSGDGARVAIDLGRALHRMRLRPRLAVVNRALSPSLRDEAPPPHASDDPRARALLNYVHSYAQLQADVRDRLEGSFERVLELPEAELHASDRLDALARLGAQLVAARG